MSIMPKERSQSKEKNKEWLISMSKKEAFTIRQAVVDADSGVFQSLAIVGWGQRGGAPVEMQGLDVQGQECSNAPVGEEASSIPHPLEEEEDDLSNVLMVEMEDDSEDDGIEHCFFFLYRFE